MSKCPAASASFLLLVHKFPDLPDGGLHLPDTPDGLCRFETPLTFAAYKAVTLEDARDGSLTGPKKVVAEMHVNWSNASAQRLRRALADSEGDNMHLLTCVDELLAQCGVRHGGTRSGGGTSTVALFNEKLQVDLLILDDIIALQVMDVFPTYSPLIPVSFILPPPAKRA